MHGRGGEEGRRRRHMWRVHAPGPAATTAAAAPPACPVQPLVSASVDSGHALPDFFLKDGRKFHVGDCALFRAGNSPAFIGIIRWFTPDKEAYLKVGVNWLYRPSDVKLAKGFLLEAAPNEVFYSFHRDEISAQSLLHPCKVTFLRKGVELPSGVSSFVCWRVYDITNKRLRWLTDTDYIDERQEEVEQLLDKTRLEMHTAVQSGGRSPKPLSSHLSSQQLKSSSDSVQNSSTSLPSQAKGKKRGERGDQGSELMKRERTSKADDGDSAIFRLDSTIKADIAKITEKGGLTNNDAVEKLVQLMQLDRDEKKIDLSGRVLLADVIAATERNDCLVRFVLLRGVPMLDDWLQEAHKGKNGDGSNQMEGDKSVEDLLLALLRALDNLPVNLNALQTCHIGKSVNNLRSHKNMEIQKKARSLVDTWKKRVDAEMTKIEMAKLNDAKSTGSSQAVSSPGKPGFSEVSVGGNKRAASMDVSVKSSTNQPPTCKSLPLKNGHDSIAKLNSSTSGSVKLPSTLSMSVATGTKDSQTRAGATSGTAELPVPTIKDEKSSSPRQSQNNSQSCSDDHAKTVGSSWKEDVRTAGLTNTSKASGGSSRQRRASNGFVGNGASGVQKDNGFGRSNSLIRNTTPEKVLQSGLTVDRTVDVPVADHGNSHRLIVRLPNPGRSPARSASGGSLEDLSVTDSRASSPGASEKNEHVDPKTKPKSDVCWVNSSADVNTSCQDIDLKGVVGSGHVHRSPTAILDERSKSTDDTGKAVDSLKAGILFEPKCGKPFETSSSSRNVLIESCKYDKNALIGSCMQYKEGSDSFPSDSTNRLFTIVNAEKMSGLSPSGDSPVSKSPAAVNPCAVNDVKSKISSADTMTQIPGQPEDNNAKTDPEKHEPGEAPLQVQDDIKQNGADFRIIPRGDGKCIGPSEETKSIGEHRDQYPVSAAALCENYAPNVTSENKLDNVVANEHVPLLNLQMDIKDGEGNSTDHLQEKHRTSGLVSDGLPDCEKMAASPSSADCPVAISTEHIPPVMALCTEDVTRNVDNATATSASAPSSFEVVDELKKGKSDNMGMKSHLETSGDEKEHTSHAASSLDRVCSSTISISNGVEEDSEKKVIEHQSVESATHEEPPPVSAHETEQNAKTSGSKLCGDETDEAVACSPEASSAATFHKSDPSARLAFDLNEGFSVDDANIPEPVTPSVPGCSSAVYRPNLTHFTVSPMSNSLPFHVTVASPAKGPFVPPETLIKSKGEGGWKGSAATSAFRPAEPRKVLDMPLGTSDAASTHVASVKQCHAPLNIDLNVADETVSEDIPSLSSSQQKDSKAAVLSNRDAPTRTSGGLDLDLNRVDESTENGQLSTSTSRRLDVPLLSVRPASGGFPDGEVNVLRDFDLNNGPGTDEAGGVEQLSRGRHLKSSNVPFLPSLRMNGNETGILSSWFPPGNSYSAVAIPSFLPERGDQPYPVVAAPGAQMMLGSAAGGGAFGNDLYRGPVLSSSPTMTFSPAGTFPYAGFPFGSSFPLASTSFPGGSTTYIDPVSGGPCFPAIPSSLMGRAGAAPSPYVRPNVISLPEGSTSGGSESNRKWGWQSLDLNSGPGSVDIEGREDRSSLTSRQLSVTSSQAFSGEQARMYQTTGGGLKRKEPEGGWDTERFPYNKQHPWH